jgi:hypothetical protein
VVFVSLSLSDWKIEGNMMSGYNAKANTTFTNEDAKLLIVEMVNNHQCLKEETIIQWMKMQLELALVPTHLHDKYNIKRLFFDLVGTSELVQVICQIKNETQINLYLPKYSTAVVVIP